MVRVVQWQLNFGNDIVESGASAPAPVGTSDRCLCDHCREI